jgi:hypothetical protein
MTKTLTLTACLVAMALTGCNRNDVPKPTTAATAVSQPGPATVESTGKSVALPPSSLPQQDAAMAPQAPSAAATVPDSASPSQANPQTLSKQQESTAMPMPGQVNNHSTPESIDKPGAPPK